MCVLALATCGGVPDEFLVLRQNNQQLHEEMKAFETMFEELEQDTLAKTKLIQTLENENAELNERLATLSSGRSNGENEEMAQLRTTLAEKEEEANRYAFQYSEMIQKTQVWEKKVKNLEARLRRCQQQLQDTKASAIAATTNAPSLAKQPLSIVTTSSSPSSVAFKRPRQDMASATENAVEVTKRPRLHVSETAEESRSYVTEMPKDTKTTLHREEDKENMSAAAINAKPLASTSSSKVPRKKPKKSISHVASAGVENEENCHVQ